MGGAEPGHDGDQPGGEELRARVQRWLDRQGCPHLKHGYKPDMSFPWAGPPLAFVFLAEVMTAPKLEWPWWQNLLALLGSTVGLLALWIVVRRVTTGRTGQRLLAVPRQIGRVEVAMFLLVPPLVPLIVGQQIGSAAAVLALNLVLLAAIYVGTSFAVVHLARWAVPKAVRELRSIGNVLVRTLPLLLLITIVLFVNAEVWQVAAGVDKPSFAAALVLLFAVGLVFLLVRLPVEITSRATFRTAAEVVGLVEPVDDIGPELAGAVAGKDEWFGERPTWSSTNQRWNVYLVALVSQSLPIAMTAVVMGAFFLALGVLIIPSGVVTDWTGSPPDVLGQVELLGRPVELSWELLMVSGFLAAFSGLYFTVVLMTDETYRRLFLNEILGEVQQTLAVWTAYEAALVSPESPVPDQPPAVGAPGSTTPPAVAPARTPAT